MTIGIADGHVIRAFFTAPFVLFMHLVWFLQQYKLKKITIIYGGNNGQAKRTFYYRTNT